MICRGGGRGRCGASHEQEESEQQSSEEETFTVMINVWRTSIKGGERTTV